MRRVHKGSGIAIEAAVIFHDEIRKYSPGVILTNTQNMKTSRMTLSPVMCDAENEAEKISFEMGRAILERHLSGEEVIYFSEF